MNNNISIFVSSTFKDMQGERDTLHRSVIPSIREFAASYGRNVDFIDLRWGISTDDMDNDISTDKILTVCLDEIEQCSPYQIVILGDRYGWIPSSNILKQASEKKNFELSNEEISVTELEIQYGLWLNRNQLDKIIFCIRETNNIHILPEEQQKVYKSENDIDTQKMRILKNKIINTPGVHILNYSLDFASETNLYADFSEKLTEKLHQILLNEWGSNHKISWIKQQEDFENLISDRMLARFSGREATLEMITSCLVCDFIVLYGKDGCGLTSIMAKLGEHIKNKGSRVKNIYCGHGHCTDTEQLIKIMIAELNGHSSEKEFLNPVPDFGQVNYWKELLDQAAVNYNDEPIYFLIDGIHHLLSDEAFENGAFLPSKGCSNNIKFIISKNKDVSINPIAVEKVGKWCHFQEINNCSKQEIRSIISSRLKSEHKQIGESVMRTLLEHPLINNMICMELILQDILNLDHQDFIEIHKLEETMGGNDAISRYLCDIIHKHPKKEADLIIYWMNRSLQNLAEHDVHEYHYLYYTVACMTLSMNGLSTEELSDMAQYIRSSGRTESQYWLNWWEEVRFSKLRKYMGNLIIKTSDGRYKFAHEQIRSALFTHSSMKKLVSGPMVYFSSLPDEAPLKQDNLLAAYLLFLCDETNKENMENTQNNYFFDYIASTFALINAPEKSDQKEGNRRLSRMLNGIRKSFLYRNGAHRVQNLCDLLTEKTKTGISIRESIIDSFVFRLSLLLKNGSIYEKSILLSCYIAIAMGYEIWEKEHGVPARGKYKHELGAYKDWSEVERRLLTRIYSEMCNYYHELYCYFDTKERTVPIPWNWDKIRDNAGLYIDVFYVTPIFRGLFCNNITLIDADNRLKENYLISLQIIKDSEQYTKTILKRKTKDETINNIIIRNYMDGMLRMASSYIKLADYVKILNPSQGVHGLYSEAEYITNKSVRKLRNNKLIKDYYDLKPVQRIRFLALKSYSGFYQTTKNKQRYVDEMWTYYCDAYKLEEFFEKKDTRDELLSISMYLMEFLLSGYMPAEYKNAEYTIGQFASYLLNREGLYMEAIGYTYNFTKNIYIIHLLRAMFILEYRETDPSRFKTECVKSKDALCYYLNLWGDKPDGYLFKCRRLCDWHEELLKNQ